LTPGTPPISSTASALRFLEETRAFLNRHAAGDLTHRHEQRQTAVGGGVGDGLVGDADGTAGQHGVEQRTLRREVEVCEDHLAAAAQLVFWLDGLLDFDDHVGDGIYLLDGGEYAGAGLDVFVVAEAAAFAGMVLYIQLMAVGHQLLHARGSHPHAVLVVLDLFWNTDFHGRDIVN